MKLHRICFVFLQKKMHLKMEILKSLRKITVFQWKGGNNITKSTLDYSKILSDLLFDSVGKNEYGQGGMKVGLFIFVYRFQDLWSCTPIRLCCVGGIISILTYYVILVMLVLLIGSFVFKAQSKNKSERTFIPPW